MFWRHFLPQPLRMLMARFRLRPSRGLRLLGRGILFAGLVGLMSGVAAVAFHLLCMLIVGHGLVGLTGYSPGGPTNETGWPPWLPAEPVAVGEAEGGEPATFRPLVLLALMTLGGLVVGMLVYGLAPEAAGPGTDAAVDAYHNKRGRIRLRVPFVKMLASAITLGTGGSGGREGPISQIGAGLGSQLAQRLGLPENQRRTLLAAGVGAGIGAIFHAPLAGAIFAIEVLYRDPDFEAEGLIPAFISTTVAYSVFSAVFGVVAFEPLFAVGVELAFTEPLWLLGPLAVLALVMTLAAQVYVRVLHGTTDRFARLRMPRMLKPALGALLAGVVGVGLYYLALFTLGDRHPETPHQALSVLYLGYGFLQQILDPGQAPMLAIVLLAVGLGKILTTALTIGSGGAAGVFGPSMVIGGSLGSLVGMGFHAIMPEVVGEVEIVVFAILGMASFFSAAAKTPVSTLIMVSELTGGYALLLPAMWCCALSYLSSGRTTLYRQQKASRLESPAHRSDFIIDILKGLTVRDAMPKRARRFETVPLDMPLSDLGGLITRTMQSTFPVVDEHGAYVGLFSLNDVRRYLYDEEVGIIAIAQDLASDVEPLSVQMDLSDAISRFAQVRFEELPVVDESDPDTVVGMLRRQDVIAEYDRQLMQIQSE